MCISLPNSCSHIVLQVSQRLADQFRSPIGSAAIAVLLAYLASHRELRDSDQNRIQWCEKMLEGFRFVYALADDPNPKVSTMIYELVGPNNMSL